MGFFLHSSVLLSLQVLNMTLDVFYSGQEMGKNCAPSKKHHFQPNKLQSLKSFCNWLQHLHNVKYLLLNLFHWPVLIPNYAILSVSLSNTDCLKTDRLLLFPIQFDIRSLCVNHWGSDQGIVVLKQLSQLYMFLIWETIVLETVSRPESSGGETKVAEKELEMLKASTSASQEEPSGNFSLNLF